MKGLTLETAASLSLYGINLTLANLFIGKILVQFGLLPQILKVKMVVKSLVNEEQFHYAKEHYNFLILHQLNNNNNTVLKNALYISLNAFT